MSKEVLESKKSALELMLSENNDLCTDYKAQIAVIDQELEDLGKPEATPKFLDKINETITEAVESLELDDGVACDFEIDYDNRVAMSDVRFEDTHDVADKIYCAVEKLFAEIRTDNSQLNTRGEGGNVVSTSGRLSCPYIKHNKSGTTKTTNGRIKQKVQSVTCPRKKELEPHLPHLEIYKE